MICMNSIDLNLKIGDARPIINRQVGNVRYRDVLLPSKSSIPPCDGSNNRTKQGNFQQYYFTATHSLRATTSILRFGMDLLLLLLPLGFDPPSHHNPLPHQSQPSVFATEDGFEDHPFRVLELFDRGLLLLWLLEVFFILLLMVIGRHWF